MSVGRFSVNQLHWTFVFAVFIFYDRVNLAFYQSFSKQQ